MMKKPKEKIKKTKKSAIKFVPMHKGQAMMEYLMTYGLALVVILIVLAILATVVLPNLQPPENCQISQPGFSCSAKKHSLITTPSDNNNVRLIFQLDNQQGSPIEVYSVLCTDAAPGNIQKTDLEASRARLGTPLRIAPGANQVFGNGVNPLNCYTLGGDRVSLSPNSNFKGSLAIMYRDQDAVQGSPNRTIIASLTGVVRAP